MNKNNKYMELSYEEMLQEIKNNCERATKLSRRADLLSMIAIAINIGRLVLIIIEAAIR